MLRGLRFKLLYETAEKCPDGVVRIVDHSVTGEDYVVEIRKVTPGESSPTTTYGTLAGS